MDGLRKLGYDAYIQKAHFEKTDELWYRVRVGAFNSRIKQRKEQLKSTQGPVSFLG